MDEKIGMLRHTVATVAYRGATAMRGAPAEFAEYRSAPDWEDGMARFFAALEAFDRRLSSGVALEFPAEKIFQGPVADALTHVGQLAMLRRMAGAKIRGENYFTAQIETGRVGATQAEPRRQFD